MFKDTVIKAAYHRERIVKEFIKRGIYPTDKLIQEGLDKIDSSLAYLQPTRMVAGQDFNVESYNAMIKMLYKDLELLYQLLYEITVKEYISLKAFVDTHLDDLENTALKYRLKAEQESNSTSLGRTIYFNHSGFDVKIENNVTLVSLGYVKVNQGSRISCFLNANDIEADRVVFGLKKGEAEPLYAAAYNYNQDSILIPGELQRRTYQYAVDKERVITYPLEMDLQGNKATDANEYAIFAGKDQILVKEFAGITAQTLAERPTKLNMASFKNRSSVDFYVVGGKQITFRFNKKPINTNFPTDDYKVSNLQRIHHFFIEGEEGFSFDFELDGGTVYAVKEKGNIEGDKLFFSRSVAVRDFYIEEYLTGAPDTYYAFVKAINDDGEPMDIESVTIKELLTFGGDIQ